VIHDRNYGSPSHRPVLGIVGDGDGGAAQLAKAGIDGLDDDPAEPTMLVLRKCQLRGRHTYAATFIDQISDSRLEVASRTIPIVSNAGGPDLMGCAEVLRSEIVQQTLYLTVSAAKIDGIRASVPDFHRQRLRRTLYPPTIPRSDHQIALTP
jgi:hypothetical protein